MSDPTPIGRRLRLTSGDTVVELGTVGAVIARCEVGGVAITEPIAEDAWPFRCNGVHLAPWPNRVRDGRWTLGGDTLQLDITEAERHNALHGFAQFQDFEVRALEEDRAVLGLYVPPQHGWPFALDLEVEFAAVEDGLRAVHRVRNLSDRSAPYGTSAHPYLRIGDADVRDLRITVPAPEYIEVDDRLNPIRTAEVAGTRFDLREGPRIGDLDLDTAFAGVHPVDRVGAWIDAPDGRRVELLQDEDWTWVQVYTEPEWPDGAGGHRTAVAVEPMTAPPDALNSGDGLVWLEPGGTWEGAWGLRLTSVR